MLTKSLLTLGVVAAMSLSMSGAFAQSYDSRDGYRAEQRADYRDMRSDRRDFRNDRRGEYRDMRSDRRDFRNERYDHGGRGNYERGGHGSWQGGHQNHFAMNSHNFGSGHRGRR